MEFLRLGERLRALLSTFARDRGGNYAVITAIASLPLLGAVALAVEYTNASRMRSDLQQRLDAAVLAGAAAESNQTTAAEQFFNRTYSDAGVTTVRFELGDGVLNGWATRPMATTFRIPGMTEGKEIGVYSQARFTTATTPAPCVTVLGSAQQALLVNSGANVSAKDCEIHVHSKSNPAMIMNAGATIDVAKTCVAGTNIIKNGGTLGGLETNCKVDNDPYENAIPAPTIPANCSSGPSKNGTTYTISPGKHCGFNINEPYKVVFEPGLHIISSTIIIPAGATVIAEGVTFYFTSPYVELRMNGGITMKATAPTSGPYKGILMFETRGTNKGPFIFNGSVSEHLEGVIYLPNRDAIYNSKTNIGQNKVAMVFNTLIINQSSWNMTGISSPGSGHKTVYLSH